MLRKILNFLVIVSIIIAISAVSLNLYSKSKLEDDSFNSNGEVIKKNSKQDSNDSSNSSSEVNDSSKDSAKKDNSTKDNNSEEKSDSKNDSSDNEESKTSGSAVSVESTGTSVNYGIAILGGVLLILGTGQVILKMNN